MNIRDRSPINATDLRHRDATFHNFVLLLLFTRGQSDISEAYLKNSDSYMIGTFVLMDSQDSRTFPTYIPLPVFQRGNGARGGADPTGLSPHLSG